LTPARDLSYIDESLGVLWGGIVAIRIVVTDDRPIFLTGLEAVLRREKDFQILVCCATGDETLLALRKQRPDVLLLDLDLRARGAST